MVVGKVRGEERADNQVRKLMLNCVDNPNRVSGFLIVEHRVRGQGMERLLRG